MPVPGAPRPGAPGTAAAGVATVAATTSGTAALITLLGFGGGGLAGFRMAHRTGGMWPTMLVLRTSDLMDIGLQVSVNESARTTAWIFSTFAPPPLEEFFPFFPILKTVQ